MVTLDQCWYPRLFAHWKHNSPHLCTHIQMHFQNLQWTWHSQILSSEAQTGLFNFDKCEATLAPHSSFSVCLPMNNDKELGLCCLLWKFGHCGANSQKHFSVCSHCTSSVSGNLLEYYLNNNHKSFQPASPGLQTAEWLLTSCLVTACLCCLGTFALSSTTCSRLVGKAKLKGQWQKGHRSSQDAVEAEEKFQSWRILWSVWNLLEILNM